MVYPIYDILEISSWGSNIGLGNRWAVEHNITIGADWFSWSQPGYLFKEEGPFLDRVTDPDDRDTVETAKKLIAQVPRFAVAKVYVGLMF